MQRRISACMLYYFSVTRENLFFFNLAVDRLAKLEVRESLAMRKHARDNVVSGVPTNVYKM